MRWYKVLDYSQKFFNFLYPFFKETEILQDFNPWNTHFRIVNGVRGSNKVSPFEISRDEERKWRILFVILWEKRNARVSNIYIYIYAYEWKFSSFHADSLQCVAALHQSRWVHILQPILLSLVPVISLPLSDVAETLGKDVPPPSPRTPSTSFVYTRLRIRNAASYPCRGSTHRRLSLSLSLFRSFFCSVTRDARTHVAFSTIGSIVAEQQSVIRFSQERLPRWTIARVSHRFHLECHSVFLSPSVLPKRQSECDRADKR